MTFGIRGLRRAGAHALRALALAGGLLVAFSASDRGAMAQLFNQFPLEHAVFIRKHTLSF